MSRLAYKGNDLGSGTITIETPNTNTDRTITLPDTTGTLLDTNSSLSSSKLTGALPAIDGSALTNLPSGGKVLQVVTATDTGSWSSSSTSFVNTNLSATITPSSTSSKILVIASVSFSSGLPGNNQGLRLARGATDLTNHQIYSMTIDGGGTYQRGIWAWHHLDSPATTSATTYYVQAGHNTNGSSISLHAAKDSITLIEIGA